MDIKNFLEVLKLTCGLFKTIDAAMEDGKVDFGDFGHLMLLMPLIGPAIEDIKLVPKELDDFSDDEVAAAHQMIEDELGVGAYQKFGKELMMTTIHIAAMVKKAKDL